MDKILTQSRLKELYSYDPATGVFVRRISVSSRARAGDIPGYITKRGYHMMMVDNSRIFAHRLAWMYVYGNMPDGEIDHINGNGTDNRIDNLRIANRAQNLCNTRRRVNNTTGFKGIHFHRPMGRYRARIQIGGKSKFLGYFDTAEEAHEAYCKAAPKYHGTFARTA